VNAPRPGFSVIIPTRNRPWCLEVCLRAFEKVQDPPDGFEVIVVDDGGTTAPCAASSKKFPVRCLSLAENRGPAAARNHGALHAHGRFLAFLDDDCIPSPEWLCRLHAALDRDPSVGAGGLVINGQTRNLYAHVNQVILDEAYRYYNADRSHARFFATMNLAVSREQFARIGGFDEAFRTAEDRDFCARWIAGGLRLEYVPDAPVIHLGAGSWLDFWRRHYRFGSGACSFRRRHTMTPAGRVRLEPPGFYRSLLAGAFREGLTRRAVLAAGLIGVSQFASALGFWAEMRRSQTLKGRSV
jgi:GT2 family glycosyltransferase